MRRIDPVNFFRRFHGRDVEIHDHRLLIAAHDHAHERFIGSGIDLLMGNERRHEDEAPRAYARGIYLISSAESAEALTLLAYSAEVAPATKAGRPGSSA